jgi:hypothetical protein
LSWPRGHRHSHDGRWTGPEGVELEERRRKKKIGETRADGAGEARDNGDGTTRTRKMRPKQCESTHIWRFSFGYLGHVSPNKMFHFPKLFLITVLHFTKVLALNRHGRLMDEFLEHS